MRTEKSGKAITILLVIVLLIVATIAVVLLFSGRFSQLPLVQSSNPPAAQNYASRQQEAPPPVDEALEEEYTAVHFAVNMDHMREEASKNSTGGQIRISAPPISPELYLAFGASEYLGGSIVTASIEVNSTDAIRVVDEHLGGGSDRPIRIQSGADIPEFMMSLQGGKFEEFNSGLRSTSEGRMPQALNECMVSEELSRTAGLSVGDTLSLSTFVHDNDKNRLDIGYELTIIGIYRDSTSEYAGSTYKNAYTNRRNEILTTFETVCAPIPTEYSGAHSGVKLAATYYLKSPDLLDAFAKEVYTKGLDLAYDVVFS